ncbi:uncharacterized protein MONBRDRAFT_11566 [Monosiga brevicollis MX1]|uniref:Uncharacterized protein n=1 Tax=Monosiga brevicollis TaxID=81824 RepID=A9V9M6_MONBE|nr:uncharacterized protein MONBRDRAFT_11566 [Monosiga brevicollis MX1]EDQ85747.1 predicted protein [Monosiga brevicollis MX1]|eukprot:XP_001749462.1 hypothetical protein [Monosiga brevicollis MX1]
MQRRDQSGRRAPSSNTGRRTMRRGKRLTEDPEFSASNSGVGLGAPPPVSSKRSKQGSKTHGILPNCTVLASRALRTSPSSINQPHEHELESASTCVEMPGETTRRDETLTRGTGRQPGAVLQRPIAASDSQNTEDDNDEPTSPDPTDLAVNERDSQRDSQRDSHQGRGWSNQKLPTRRLSRDRHQEFDLDHMMHYFVDHLDELQHRIDGLSFGRFTKPSAFALFFRRYCDDRHEDANWTPPTKKAARKLFCDVRSTYSKYYRPVHAFLTSSGHVRRLNISRVRWMHVDDVSAEPGPRPATVMIAQVRIPSVPTPLRISGLTAYLIAMIAREDAAAAIIEYLQQRPKPHSAARTHIEECIICCRPPGIQKSMSP